MTSKRKDTFTLSDILEIHLGGNYDIHKDASNELEVRFGTRGRQKITRIDFDNVIKKLKSLGWTCINDSGDYSLKIQNEFVDPKTGETKLSNIRTQIETLNAIQQYCKTNDITQVSQHLVKYEMKMYAKTKEEQTIYPINKDSYNLRISYQTETKLSPSSSMIKGLHDTWQDSKKTFRYINRITYRKDGEPYKIDLSVVKSNNSDKRRRMIPTYRVDESGVFDNTEGYEIEIEMLPRYELGAYNDVDLLESALKTGIKTVLAGLQESNYPISYDEQDSVKQEYVKLFKGSDYEGRVYNRDFIGPSSYTLQMTNVTDVSEDSIAPNIRNNYTVTDKADGQRKMMYVGNNGKIYLIDTNLNIQYTGCTVKTKDDFAGTLIDGEHILHDKEGNFINLYAAFDIYYRNKQSVREKMFVSSNSEDLKENQRLHILINTINSLEIKEKGGYIPMTFEYKRFYMEGNDASIFDGCKLIMDRVKDGLIKYNTDGLIFTPAEFAVGGSSKGKASALKKITWDYSFKWKPPEYNTIDFLVVTKKGDNNQDEVGNIFQKGEGLSDANTGIVQYKTLELNVGFDTRKHGYINPCGDVIQDNLPSVDDVDDYDTYKPMKFYPTEPYDDKAHLCRINLTTDFVGNKIMLTEEGEVFGDNTIVEFSYDMNEPNPLYRWKPLRVRYDKTAEFKAGLRNFGNAYHVANNNWKTIHNPITLDMITTGDGIPTEIVDDDVYYNRVTKTTFTRSLRDFHNLVVKKKLITSVAQRNDTLIDFAVGKGGDFSKWIAAKLGFVFGIDISSDNITNKLDGACARYLNYRKQYKSMPYALFVTGDSSKNIKNTLAIDTERDKLTTRAIFGEGPKSEDKLGKGVLRQYGKGAKGFNISSCQFALHYFFESRHTCDEFFKNVAECTELGGYFIGGCYDGSLIFDDLRNKKRGESMIIMENDNKIWEVTKDYDRDTFTPDVSSLGYTINVYQESINKTFPEYLVNFEFLVSIMEKYGFIPLPEEECRDIGLKSGVGSFKDIFNDLKNTIKRKPYLSKDIGDSLNMTTGEKTISFYNKYFIFKKIRIVDTNSQESSSISDVSSAAKESMTEQSKAIEKPKPKSVVKTKTKRKTRKRKGTKLKLVPSKTNKDK